MVFAGQIFTGLNFAYNSTYFFQQIGLDPTTTYHLNVGGTGMGLFATLICWIFVMPYVGRRTAYLRDIFVMTILLMLIGGLNKKTENDSVAMAQAVLALIWTFVFQLSSGQLGWAIPAEVGSTRLRQKTICLARNAYAIANIVSGVLQPYFMNPTEWNLKGYTETKDRTFEELDLLFAKGVPACKFSTYNIETFRDTETGTEKVQSHASLA
ncbi:hypothetical protein LRP88_10951 [Fusarium phalaenopsidis]